MDEPKKPTPADLRETLPTMASGDIDESNQETVPDHIEIEPHTPTLASGTQIGKYRIEKVLGVGGMGAVYRATQSKPQRQVALKLIRPGVLSAKSIRRFDLEAEILGRLDHPNIAKIHEAGIDPQTKSPYFAMEYVHGKELGDYVSEYHLGIHDRLELFAKLCDAIQHAHAKGVIHRDLKPANVLVSPDGEPKVLDFGVARATDSNTKGITLETNIGQLIGTLYYMSPEQAIGDTLNLDTRSDVYALGIVLFEILAGEIPYDLKDKPIHEIVQVIQNTNPTRLSKYDQAFKGDIEIIVGKALEKEKDQRYQTVADLSADIRRTLSNMPILARPPSIVYRTSKFVRRNRRLTIAALCVLLIFSFGSGFALTQWVRRIEARQLALDNMLTALNEMDVQKGLGRDLYLRLLDLYSDNGEALFSGDRESLALFYANLGQAYFVNEDYNRALGSYEKAYTIRITKFESPHPMIADALHNVANAEFYLNKFDRARLHYEQTLAMYEKLYRPNDPGSSETARTLDHLGSTCVKLGDHETALKVYTRAKELRVALFGAGSLQVAMSNNSIAWYHVQQDQYEIAEPIYREALTLLQALPENESKPLWVARAMHSLGNTLINLEKFEEADSLLREALDLKQALLSNNKPSVALTLQSLATVNLQLEKYTEAEQYALQVVQIREETQDPKLDLSKSILENIRSQLSD
jgi:serine/threonine protein kinase